MSLFCAISGQPPLHPVLSIKSGHVYEKALVTKYLKENEGRDPITGDTLTEDDLIEIKTGQLCFPQVCERETTPSSRWGEFVKGV